MALFFTADQHFGHDRIIELAGRPFSSVDEMDEEIIRRHNERISRSDDVYFVGDFSHKGSREYIQKVFSRLNGRKHLIIGNHDHRDVLKLPWSSVPSHFKRIKDREGRTFVLCHYAQRSWDKMYKGSFHFFGHTHGRLKGLGKSTDVGVDAWDFAPVTADEAIRRMMEWNDDFDTYAPEEDNVIRGRSPMPAM